jgi:hypothetical protein
VSYRRTLIFLVIFLSLGGFFYLYEIRGGKERKEAEENAKLVVFLKPEEVTAITLERPNETIILKKENSAWDISEPVSAPAEQQKIEQLLSTLADLKFERDLGEQADIEPFGLAKPQLKIKADAGDRELGSLFIGAATPDGKNLYVKKETGNHIYTVAASAKNQLDQNLFSIRDKKLFDFSPPDVTAIALHRGTSVLSLERKAENQWSMTTPPSYEADPDKITETLDSFKYARIKKFVAENSTDMKTYGIDKPSARIQLWLKEKQIALSFGKKVEIQPEMTYASVDGSGKVIELEGSLAEKITATTNDWRDKSLVKINPDEVTQIEIATPQLKMKLEQTDKEPGHWMMLQPEQKRADDSRVDMLLGALQKAKTERFVEKEKLAEAKKRLEKPDVRLQLWRKNEEQATLLAFARATAGNEWFVSTGSGDAAFVNEELMKEFSINPDDYTDKSVLHFEASNIEQIELKKNKTTYALKRKDVDWDMPQSLKKMQSYEIDQLLWDLHELRYEKIEPKEKQDSFYGFDAPALTITLRTGEKSEPQTLVVGKKSAETGSFYVTSGAMKDAMTVEGKALAEFIDKL